MDTTEEPIVLPGESLAKYRDKPVAAPAPSPVVEHETHDQQPEAEEITPRAAGNVAPTASGGSVPRRFSGGLPRWLLADGGAEAEAAPSGEPAAEAENITAVESNIVESESARREAELNEDQVAALASGFVEAKHEETSAEAEADAVVGGAEFEEEEEETEEEHSEAEEIHAEEVSELTAEETQDVEEQRAVNRAEAEADFAHDTALHAAGLGEHEHAEHELEHDRTESEHADSRHVLEGEHVEEEVLSASASVESVAAGAAIIEEDVILLPGETRAPRVGGASAPREDFPRDSARIGGNPRSRFQRPFRSGGRDRGRDNRGGRPDSRGGRPDSRGGRPDRGGRPGGPRFERRPSGGPRHDRGYQGGHSGPSRRPQLISEMLKAGQDVVIQIAQEPLGT
jgi:hypothetical protein